jgi:hypothetical protein
MVLNVQERTLRQYLLGELSEKEQEALEQWLMSEEEAYDQLAAAEDDLIDESMAGKLNRHELERFNNYFLNAPARKRKLWFGQAFRKFVDRTPGVPARNVPAPPVSFWDLFRQRPVFGYAVIALVVLVIGGGSWAGFKMHDMQGKLAATTKLADEREDLKRLLDERRATDEQLQADFHTFESAVANVRSLTLQGFQAITLMPGITRTAADVQRIDLKSEAQIARLSLTLLDANYDSYRAVVLDDSGKEIWTRERLTATADGKTRAIILMIPMDRLTAGDFIVRLSGRTASNTPENIGTYAFRATR